jgi:hypothetical protein
LKQELLSQEHGHDHQLLAKVAKKQQLSILELAAIGFAFADAGEIQQ